MKIVTWNVNSIRTRLEIVLKWIDQHEPDVLLLQETKCVDESFPREFFEDRGYLVETYGQKTYNGVAIVSKYSIEDVQRGLPNNVDPQCRYIEGVINGHVRVASLYVPNGESKTSEKFIYKQNFLDKLLEYLPERQFVDEVFIIGGDFNIAPTPQDVNNQERWEGKVMCTPTEREYFQQLLGSGFIDVIRHKFPHNKQLDGTSLVTWWDYRKGSWQKDEGVRIDHFLLSRNHKITLQEAGIDREPRGWERPSDHAPVWCVIKP